MGDLDRLADDYNAMRRERDEARAEVERLRALLPPSAHTGVRNGPGEGSWAVFAEKVVAERDELRHKLAGEAAHIRSLEDLLVEATRERDNARAEVSRREREHGALVETAQKALENVAAERDEARAQLAALREAASRARANPRPEIVAALDAAIYDPSAVSITEAHDRRVRAAALREAADAWRDSSYVYKGRNDLTQKWLRRRAGEIEKGER